MRVRRDYRGALFAAAVTTVVAIAVAISIEVSLCRIKEGFCGTLFRGLAFILWIGMFAHFMIVACIQLF